MIVRASLALFIHYYQGTTHWLSHLVISSQVLMGTGFGVSVLWVRLPYSVVT